METNLQPYIHMSDVKTGRNCMLTSIYNITKHYGSNLSEADLFILSNSINIKYNYDLYSIGKISVDILRDLGTEAFIHANIRRKDYEGISPEDMVHTLEKNNLILLLVDTENLRYSRIYSENENRQHAIILNGFSADKKQVHIVDPHLTDYSGGCSIYEGTITLEEVMAATYTYAWFDFDKEKNFTKEKILKTAVREFECFLQGSVEKEWAVGLEAVRCFVNDFHKLELIDDNRLAPVCKEINYSIKVKSINQINKFMIEIITEYSVEGGQNYDRLINSINELISAWEKLGMSILRVGISKRRGSLSDVQAKGLALFEWQLSVYKEFANYLRELTVESRNKKVKGVSKK